MAAHWRNIYSYVFAMTSKTYFQGLYSAVLSFLRNVAGLVQTFVLVRFTGDANAPDGASDAIAGSLALMSLPKSPWLRHRGQAALSWISSALSSRLWFATVVSASRLNGADYERCRFGTYRRIHRRCAADFHPHEPTSIYPAVSSITSPYS